MIGHIASLTSLIDRCAHRAAMHVRTKTALLNNSAPIVSFTFDDVPESAFSVGAAILAAHGVKSTFYIAGTLCDTVDPDGRSLITTPECRELHRRGHEIGCHTFSHRKVGSLGHQALQLEIERNQAFFSALDSSIVLENFAYPYNRATPSSKLMLQRRFRSCRAGVPGVNVAPWISVC
jgi:peptidoglycan/xylan/chitin deacetylase (PgdA/CDA1 family)